MTPAFDPAMIQPAVPASTAWSLDPLWSSGCCRKELAGEPKGLVDALGWELRGGGAWGL